MHLHFAQCFGRKLAELFSVGRGEPARSIEAVALCNPRDAGTPLVRIDQRIVGPSHRTQVKIAAGTDADVSC